MTLLNAGYPFSFIESSSYESIVNRFVLIYEQLEEQKLSALSAQLGQQSGFSITDLLTQNMGKK